MSQLSYWEKQLIANIDYCVVGSGIVGLTCALQLKKQNPNANVLILERGTLPNGASTKNAGFACFGSMSEILADLKTMSKNEVVALIKMRIQGLALLQQMVGDQMDYQLHGGFELFLKKDESLFQHCLSKIGEVNELLMPLFDQPVFQIVKNSFGFSSCLPRLIYNPFEGQLNPQKMITTLLTNATRQGVTIFNGVEVNHFEDHGDYVRLSTNQFECKAKQVFIATNGFAHKFLGTELQPARAQVLITEPLSNLPFQGTFHIEEGFYYFRNIEKRILLGGGRNLDFQTENTSEMELNLTIQTELDRILKEVILPNQEVKIDHRWTGIMGIGATKQPIVKHLSKSVVIGVRLGGMGIAIGSLVGKQLAGLAVS